MASPTQLTAQIKFHLSQMSTENAQHAFEHLCRKLCRKRICSNILPATGPVSAGGDQGRDFETLRTYITNAFGGNAFIGLASSKNIVFACSLQKDNIQGKIKSDVVTIISQGLAVDEVHFFSTEPIAVGKRHELQQWARDTHRIHLEIYDLNAISEFLSERDTFWIAIEHLSLPPELMPQPEATAENDWYLHLRQKYSNQATLQYNYAEFYELKSAIREATFKEDHRIDLHLWIDKFSAYLNLDNDQLSRFALYEIAVASLRGLETLEGIEFRLKDLFAEMDKLTSITDLENLSILNKYIVGAIMRGLCSLQPAEVTGWHISISQRLQRLIRDDISKEYRAGLIEILASHLTLNENFEPKLEIERSLPWWQELLRLIPSMPLYPLERLSDRLNATLEVTGQDRQLERIAQEVDELLAKRFGNIKAGEKCRDRAISYYRKDQLIPAIEQAHIAKIKWFSHETRRMSALTMLFLSDCYLKLGLHYASKYHIYAALKLATQNAEDNEALNLTTKILVSLSDTEFHAGCYLNFLDVIGQYLKAYSIFKSTDIETAIDDPGFQRMLAHVSLIIVGFEKFSPREVDVLKSRIAELGLDELVEELLKTARATWSHCTVQQMKALYVKQLGDRPFSDCGKRRNIRWAQSGLKFTISCENEYAVILVAEQIASTLQILLCDLASIDLCLLSGDVTLELFLSEKGDTTKLISLPDNSKHRWRIEYPRNLTSKAPWETGGSISMMISLLMRLSLLPTTRFGDELKSYFQRGSSSKLLIGNPYEDLAQMATGKDLYNIHLRRTLKPLIDEADFPLKEHPELAWRSGPGLGYGQQDTNNMLRRRYDVSLSQIRTTLPKLLGIQAFKETIHRLKEEGWLDWHMLGAISAMRINHLVAGVMDAQKTHDSESYIRISNDISSKPEVASSPTVPLDMFSYESIRMQILMNMISTLTGLGLECKMETPNFDAILVFLRHRFGYLTDDIIHDDPFLSA